MKEDPYDTPGIPYTNVIEEIEKEELFGILLYAVKKTRELAIEIQGTKERLLLKARLYKETLNEIMKAYGNFEAHKKLPESVKSTVQHYVDLEAKVLWLTWLLKLCTMARDEVKKIKNCDKKKSSKK